MKIEETLTIEIYGLDADEHPWKADDYRIERLKTGLSQFVRMVANKYAKAPAESELIVMTVAKDLFDSFYAEAVAEILRERVRRQEP